VHKLVRRPIAYASRGDRLKPAECHLFHCKTGFQEDMRCAWILVPEPKRDHGKVEAGLQQVHCGRRPEGMWRYRFRHDRRDFPARSFNGEVEMRKTDHQLQQGLFISKWDKAGGKFPMDQENTGHTFIPVKYYEPYVASTPTSCQMKRP